MNPYTVIIPSCTYANVNAQFVSLAAMHPGAGPYYTSIDACVIANGGLLNAFGGLPWHTNVIKWRKPFNFSACINAGVRTVPLDRDILLLNDDTRLLTPNGFDLLCEAAYAHPECGLMFPSVTGCTGNPEQVTQRGGGVRYAKRTSVPFIGVYIRRAIWEAIGELDEEFCLDYGYEDQAYCTRVRAAGYKLGIFDGCRLEHGKLPSSYRPTGVARMEKNRALYEQKYGAMRDALVVKGACIR